MNDYGFDYLNYITNVPNNQNYMQSKKMNMNYPKTNQTNNMKMMNPYSVMMDSKQILDPMKGFIRGNLFENLYDPYKTYKPMELSPTNEREALLYQLMQYKFALTELDLYLDTHPNDGEAVSLYHNYLTIEKQMCDQYESMYGPLTLDSNYLGQNRWNWKNSPWPWEVM